MFLEIFDTVCSETELVGEETNWDHSSARNLVDTETGKEGRFHKLNPEPTSASSWPDV